MQTERASASAKVLLVDDEAYNRALLRAHFEPSGYTCIEASSGTQALALAASERPDLVLLDVLIPEMDGDTVLAELKLASARQHEDLPVMLVTALDIHDLKHTTAVVLASLLDIARAEESPLEVRREPVSLSRIVAPLVTARVAAAQARGCYIATDLDAESTTPLDADLVSRIVENALDNALRYTPVDGCAQLRIGNTGKPIPVEARLSIFEKYDQAERKDDRGSNRGLGLYFGRLAAEAHGGKIWVEEEAEMPTVFVVSLPAEIIQ